MQDISVSPVRPLTTPIFVSWHDPNSTIGIRPIMSTYKDHTVNNGHPNPKNSTSNRFKLIPSSSDYPSKANRRLIGSPCSSNSQCYSRVPRSHCSFANVCECLFSFKSTLR